ncbi:MAG: FtsX-like permease family protein [Deltaproteobacteria bacterium]|nr:FtsX-like permease family protein [Deltaproteobacteria bacterium]
MSMWTLIRRNLGRNRLRTILTTLAIASSIFLVCAVMTLPSVRDAILARSANGLRLIVHHKYGISFGNLPLAYAQQVRAIPHVVGVTHLTWFGGLYGEPKDFFPNYAVDTETIGEVLSDYKIDPAVLEEWKHRRDGALVGARTMRKFGWKIGDEVTLRDSPWFGISLTFKLIGEIPEANAVAATVFFFSRQYFDEALRPYDALGSTGWMSMLMVMVDQPEHVNTVINAIDNKFRNATVPTVTETQSAFLATYLNSFASIVRIVMLVGFLVVAASVLIAANTAAMSVRERIGEVAVLKTIGFQRRTIFTVLLSEALVMAGLGGALGAGPAYLILNAGKSSWSPFLGPLGMFIMPVSVMIQGLFLALLVGILAGVIPSRGAARLNVATALRQLV